MVPRLNGQRHGISKAWTYNGKSFSIYYYLYGEKVIQDYKKFDWLINKKTGRRQEIDIYVPSLNLAIEYQGEQHYRPVCFGGMSKKKAEKQFWYIKKLDRIKCRKIKSHPEDIKYFITFPYTYKIKENRVRELLKEYRII